MNSEERDGAIPLREYVDLKIQHERELRAEWLKMNAQLVADAKTFVSDKLEKMNELREQISQERVDYVSKTTYEAKHEAIEMRIRSLENAGSNLQGKTAVIGGLIGIVVIIIAHFWK